MVPPVKYIQGRDSLWESFASTVVAWRLLFWRNWFIFLFDIDSGFLETFVLCWVRGGSYDVRVVNVWSGSVQNLQGD